MPQNPDVESRLTVLETRVEVVDLAATSAVSTGGHVRLRAADADHAGAPPEAYRFVT